MSGQELVLTRLSSELCGDGLLSADEPISKLFRLARRESTKVKTDWNMFKRAYKMKSEL